MTSDSTKKVQQHESLAATDRSFLPRCVASMCSRKHVDRMILVLAVLVLCEVSNFSPVWFFYANCPSSIDFDPVAAVERMYRQQLWEQQQQQQVAGITPMNLPVQALPRVNNHPQMAGPNAAVYDPSAAASLGPIQSNSLVQSDINPRPSKDSVVTRIDNGPIPHNTIDHEGMLVDPVKTPLSDEPLTDIPSKSAASVVNVAESPAKDAPKVLEAATQSSTTTRTRWYNEHEIVHILTTRFMQLQPNLLHLGKARLDLFRTFTLPSVVAQTTADFLWMIFTDPDLHPTLRQELVNMVAPYPNIVVLGTNKSFKDFRTTGWMMGLENHVMSGDWTTVLDYREAAKSHILLETRIDADDSIFVDLIKSLQLQTVDTMMRRPLAANGDGITKKEFRVMCTESHLEWGYFNPWNKESKIGHLFGITEPTFCISAGLTYAYQVGTSPSDLPTKAHNQMDKKLPVCGTGITDNCLERIRPVVTDALGNITFPSNNDDDDDDTPVYIMLRSRTPTSAGMQGVIPTETVRTNPEWPHRQNATWAFLESTFGVSPASIHALRGRLAAHMEDILADALAGQCVKAEFTCKEQTQADLQLLLKQVREHS